MCTVKSRVKRLFCLYGGEMNKNPRLVNRKLYEEQVRLCKRRVAGGEPCGICGRPIDLSAPQYVTRPDGKRIKAPWTMEVDHIIPLARGGALTSDNVQPAHRACNLRKGGGSGRKTKAIVAETSREW